ncbi:MAG: hypothetical protein K0Q68_3090 [Moraxellaceae bacterium]|jgi:predicted Zn finger-like uncharacterized protein|nr:hypothetical protein [Moraxellaceae bacterium]
MTDAKQTKCPHCGSSFRITDAQLAAKGGSVRCGSCLQVFRADQHLVGAPAPAPAPAAPATAKPRTKGGPADESWAMDLMGSETGQAKGKPDDWKLPEPGGASDDFGFSDDDISSFIAKGSDSPVEAAPGKSVLFDDELSDQLEEAGSNFLEPERDTHRLSENADESWAQDILSELETEEHKAARNKDLEIVDEKSKPGPKNPKLAAAVGMRAAASAAAAPAAPPPPARKAPPPAPSDDFLGDDADVLSFLDNDDLSQPAGSMPAPQAANPFALERPLAHVDAPVTLKPPRDPIRWGYILGWGFMCLLALALLASQYIFFNFEKLATTPSIRPVFERVCGSLGCYLPDIPDPTRLKVDELVVRKHPLVPGALVVDAILKNHARFAQPFPSLRLRFSNSAEEVIASRLLKPAEYLRGEARRLRRMPPDTPIRISIEVVDPGQEAISYGLDPVL